VQRAAKNMHHATPSEIDKILSTFGMPRVY